MTFFVCMYAKLWAVVDVFLQWVKWYKTCLLQLKSSLRLNPYNGDLS